MWDAPNLNCTATYLRDHDMLQGFLLQCKVWCDVDMSPWAIACGTFETCKNSLIKISEIYVKQKPGKDSEGDKMHKEQYQRSGRVEQVLRPMGRICFIACGCVRNLTISLIPKSSHPFGRPKDAPHGMTNQRLPLSEHGLKKNGCWKLRLLHIFL